VQVLAIVEAADAIFAGPITFFGIGQKVRIGKWPEMVPFVGLLPHLLSEQGGFSQNKVDWRRLWVLKFACRPP
jgi:hypothetical protein